MYPPGLRYRIGIKKNPLSKNTKGLKTKIGEKAEGALSPKQWMPAMHCEMREPSRFGQRVTNSHNSCY